MTPLGLVRLLQARARSKPSRFNIVCGTTEAPAIFNSSTGGWKRFAGEQIRLIEAGKIDALSADALRAGFEIGAFVDRNVDELESYRAAYKFALENRTRAAYVVAVTFRCNLTCPYCFEGSVRHGSPSLDEKRATRLITAIESRCADQGTRELSVMLFGGEPLVKLDHCLQIFEALKLWTESRHGMRFTGSMSSNGVLFTQKNIDQLAPFLSIVQMTLDGPRELHDRTRCGANGKPTFDAIIRSMHLLASRNIRVHLRVQVSRLNRSELPVLLQQLKDAGVLDLPGIRISLGVLQEFSSCSSCEFSRNYIEPGSDEEKALLSAASCIEGSSAPAVQILPCILSGNVLCVDPLGNLYKCITQLHRPELRVGRLTEESTFEFNDRLRDYQARDPLEFEECRNCAYLPLCGGGCPTAALENCGTYHQSYCSDRKLVLDQRIQRVVNAHAN